MPSIRMKASMDGCMDSWLGGGYVYEGLGVHLYRFNDMSNMELPSLPCG